LLFFFENCVIDADRRELRRGSEMVALEPQVFDLLLFLIRNRDRVVTKDDVFASVWGGRIVSESALSTRINAVRTAIGDSGEAQRLLRTLPRKGFRFVGEVREGGASPAEEAIVTSSNTVTLVTAEQKPLPAIRIDRRRWILSVAIGVFAAVVGAVVLAPLVQRTFVANRGERFDPARVPMVDPPDQATVDAYPRQPDYKAIALSSYSIGVSHGAPDIESAKTQALQKCSVQLEKKSACTLYAVGMDVVWPGGIIPLPPPGDLRTEPLSAKFTPSPLFGSPGEIYPTEGNHRALARAARIPRWVSNRVSREEAIRRVLEKCGYDNQLPCLLVSVDGFWTIEMPAAHQRVANFFPSIAPELPSEARQRIQEIYRGPPWRALARGRQSWHAIAGAASEADAIEKALQACGKVDSDCKLFAIGNFRIRDN